MVAESTICIGLDRRGGAVYAARVEHHTGRPEVKALFKGDDPCSVPAPLLEGGRVVFSVPDSAVTVKRVALAAGEINHIDLKVRFELTQSLLEDGNDFCFDTIFTGPPHKYLGVVLRRSVLAEIRSHFSGGWASENVPDGWRVRAAALGKGYLAFCQREGGDLVCLVDFDARLASICFVFQDNVVALAHLALDGFDLNTSEGVRSMAVELKTVLNFRQAALFQEGFTVPLSNLIVSGEGIDDRLRETLGEFFPTGISAPRINSGFFSDPAQLAATPPENCLVALGLTVK